MPCNDITEIVILRFDANDRLRSYSLKKQACGAEVGHAQLLATLFAGRTAEELLAITPAAALEQAEDSDDAIEFLIFKHLVAVQEAAEVLLGRRQGGLDAACTTVSVLTDERGLRFEGLIAIDALTERIRACGDCSDPLPAT